MAKLFFEVFPTLQLEEENQMLLNGVEVMKVTSTSAKDYIKIFITSSHLIPKKNLYDIERSIETQLFRNMNIPVTIIDTYQLSGQYTPEVLFEEYKESILWEIGRESTIERNMFQKAKHHFEEGNILTLTLEIFEERFHLPIEVRIQYEQVK